MNPPEVYMTTVNYMPAGRTSRIVRGSTELQIQTEYAYRPTPRLTTTVFAGGQVIHKIEKELSAGTITPEDKMKIEGLLRRQHMEVVTIVNSKDFRTDIIKEKESSPISQNESLLKNLSEIDGVKKAFRIDNEGNFESGSISDDFKKKYSAVFKNLCELMDIFRSLPGGRREQGVYEIEHNRLYLVSSGHEFYFVLTRRIDHSRNIESELRAALNI